MKSPEDVFTPRSGTQLNDEMYVDRPELEADLTDAINGSKHVIVHGHSGTGKSWLCARVLKNLGAYVVTANFANVSRLGSLQAELKNILEREGSARKKGFSEKKSGGLHAGMAKADFERTNDYELGGKEPLEACFEHARKKAGKKPACLILENLERIIEKPALLEELADTIILLDDPRYSQYGVKIIITGIPSGVKEYFAKTPNLSPIANRLHEVGEVGRLTPEQAAEIARRGFVDELELKTTPEDLARICEYVCWVTDKIPQRVQEYCLELAKVSRSQENVLQFWMVSLADKRWLRASFSADCTVIDGLMNANRTKANRRNQCIYALGGITIDEFKYSDVEDIVRTEFPESVKGTALNISGILGELANCECPIIKRSPKGNAYVFADPRYRMCIRAMLEKNADGTVTKR